MGFQDLLEAVEKETQSINELLSYMTQQRDAVVKRDLGSVQDLTKLLHSSSLDARKYETLREKAAAAVAEELHCEKSLRGICAAMGEGGEPLRLLGEKLENAVKAVGAESKILKRLMEEGQKFNDMMLSEMRRLVGGEFPEGMSMDIKG